MNLPNVARPEAIESAAAVLEARERDLVEAETAVREAKAGIDAARAEDRLDYAKARDAGENDPGARHLERAQRELEDRERQRDGERLRVEQATSSLDEALSTHREAWSAELEQAQARADTAALRALDRFETAERERAELRAARTWLQTGKLRVAQLPTRLLRNQNGDAYMAAELVEGLRVAVASSTLDAERARVVERERQQQQAERAAAQRQQWREQGVPG